ncbi:hypothetical protein RJ640_019444 [Escallonia rubra]|uniref:CCHC-type domain-containing protein n=1 Tax=Escallonia rubra TaxID=112253 RepID=A0AA88QXS0_9ASTE|nr:hypothetical protein RJ640_019444 [Escallonia rubra]
MSKLGQIKTPKEKYPKVETSQSSPKHINMIEDIGSESEIEPDKLEKQFITAIGATNSRPPLRNYYTRPTPVDMQLEENNFSNPSSFNGSSIYEWNLDGMTNYQVITLLQHMLMAANSARNRNLGESETVIARYLIAGFTGQLRGWWDFYLTPTDQNNILNSIKIEPNGNPILINEQPLSDAVTTLVTAITKHFIGNASTVLERGRELLINLRCPTLTHFRWYKDVFMSKLYQRSDAQQDFWKERFIAGLPNLFSERVRTRIRNKHNGALPFSLYTFGELISEICAEGLVLCNDIKLKNQIKKEHKSGRTELGQFCYQFGYDTLSVPNYGTQEKVSKTRKSFRKPKFSKKYRKEESSKPFKRFSKRKSFPKSKVICHKCGKPGHYANKCYTKQKINELIIDEDLRKQLNEILLNNRTNRAWYRISFSTEQRAQYKELFFQTLKAYKTYFHFFGWFYSYCLDNNIEIPEYMNPQKQINVFKRITREWYIWPTHEKQESIHPPFNKFAMKGDMNSNFLAAPLKHIVDTSTSNHLNSVTAGEIQSLAEQSNYTNIILSTIGEQTTRIEDTIFQVKDVVSDFYSKMQPPKGISDNIFGTSPSFNLASSSSSVVRNIEQPLIKPSIDLDSRFKLIFEEPSGEFLKELMSKLGQIKTPKEKYPKVETSQSSPKHINMIGDIGSESEIEPDKLEKQFITAIGATNSRPPLRNYYTRPTPVDMQLEEKNFSNPLSFNGSSIYEWNLDGMTDYHVITLLQHMLMAANSARNRNLRESEAVIARYLIAGFTGQLRGWWDFYLTPTNQNNILNSIKIEPNGNPILINKQPLSDAVTTLVTAITKHFIGNASTVLERGRELLINLRCPTLTHFRWYKDVFMSKLYQRSDAQQDFWKERFIAGLPNLFSERVRTRIRNKHNGALPFSLYTFGELISVICAEGLVLCNDIKLKNQLKKEHKSGRTELGQFCYQFGYDTLSVPNYGTKEKVSKTRKPFRKPKFSKKYRKEESSKPFKRFSKRKSFPKTKVICHKCGKPGHYANKCYTKQKINELIIDEDLRKQLNEILLNPSDSEDNHSLELNNIDGDINSFCSSSNHSSDHEDTCHDCNSKTDYYKAILDINGLSINVITSEESIILDLLDKIDDPEKKKQVIFKYLHGKQSPPTPNDSKQIPTIGNTFNFSTVMDRLQTIELKGPTIQDLQGEILSLKRDVKTLSTRISLLELHNIEEVKREEEEEEIYLNDNNNRLKIYPDIINDTKIPSPSKEQEILSIDRVVFQKWYVSIKIVISKDFTFEGIALIDSGADLNCIKEGLVPTKYCETTRQALTTANNGRMKINYKISESWVCNDGICLKTHFIVVRGLSQSIILGTPFLSLLNPMIVDDKGIHSKALDHDICFKFINPPQEQIIHSLKKELIFRQNQICFLKEDLKFQKINRSLDQEKERIRNFQRTIESEICAEVPNEFWHRKQHIINLPYEPDFNERDIPTKARPIQMSQELLNHCKKEIQDLLDKRLIRKNEIREKTQLQRFLGSLNYIADFYQDLYKDTKVLYQRLQKNPQPWTIVHTQAIRRIKLRAKTLPCLCLPLPEAFKIVETDASDIGYGGILKQKVDGKMTPPRNSGYNAHAHCPDIIQIEDEEQDLSPIEVANNYLTNGWAYPQKASGKSRDYYEEILRLTKSAVLTHNFEKPPRHSSRNIELPFQFSKVEILKFITKKQWGIDPTRIRELPPHFSPRHFNYFDYIDAWNHVLLYQNPSHKHFWFIFFSRNFDGNFPNWIANWWLNYGPDFEEWPSTQVTEAYQLYAPMVKGLPKLQFMADFSIPWILCWQYAIQKSTNSSLEYPPTLVRQFGSKWWPKFDDSHCYIEAVTELFPTLKAASTKWKSYPKTKSHALHCDAEFSKRKNEILCRLSKEKPFLNKRELLQVVTFEMLKMSEEDYNADSDNSANSTKESSSGKEGSDEPITDNMSTGPTIDNMLKINPDIINDTKIPSPSKEQEILSIDRVVFKKWKALSLLSTPFLSLLNPMTVDDKGIHSKAYPSDFEDNHSLELNNIDGDINSSCSSSNHSSDHEDTCHDCNCKTDYYKAILDINGLNRFYFSTVMEKHKRKEETSYFDDSLLGMVETSLCNGPMYFNCYPNFSVSLSDPHIMDVLTLDIKTQRYNMRPQAQNLVLIYRIYYKAMSTICPAFKQIADPGKSVILFQSDPDKTNVMLPRRIKFNELTPPEDWIIENKATHRQVNPQNTQIDHIIETTEGDVKIRFSQPETSSQNYS